MGSLTTCVGSGGAPGRASKTCNWADRAYAEILQEVRVAQTGVQILFAFLLALAFQARFPAITSFQRGVYVVTLILCAAATALLIAPAGGRAHVVHHVVVRAAAADQAPGADGRRSPLGR